MSRVVRVETDVGQGRLLVEGKKAKITVWQMKRRRYSHADFRKMMRAFTAAARRASANIIWGDVHHAHRGLLRFLRHDFRTQERVGGLSSVFEDTVDGAERDMERGEARR